MSTPEPPPGSSDWPSSQSGESGGGPDQPPYVPVSPLLPDDPPRVDGFWLDARLSATPAGIAFTAHDEQNQPAMVLLLSEGAAADAAARARLAGEINGLHIDTVLARGGQGQDIGPDGTEVPSARTTTRQTPDQRLVRALGGAGLRRVSRGGSRSRPDPGLGRAGNAAAPRAAVRSGLPAVLGRTGAPRAGPALATALARKIRPGRLADHPGLLAADASAGGSCRADRDLDLPPPAAAVSPAADRRVGQPSAPVEPRRSPDHRRRRAPAPQSGSPSPVGVTDGQRPSGSPSPSGTQSGGGRPTSSGSSGATNTPGSREAW